MNTAIERRHDRHGSDQGADRRTDGTDGTQGTEGAEGSAAGGRRRFPLVAALTALVGGLPLGVALVVLFHPRIYPMMDIAQTELLVRDVGTRHPPLVGLASRTSGFGTRGSHPGPLSFWALWPFYKVFGSSSWSLQVASVALNLVAMSVAIWIGHRRGGRAGALAVAVVLAVVARAYGPDRLVDAWVANLPVLWWVVFLLAAWSVLCDDLVLLPVAAVAGTYVMQTHVSYLGLVSGIGAAVAAVVVWRVVHADPPSRPRLVRLAGATAVVVGVLWLPPLVDAVRGDPSNFSVVRESFMNSPGVKVGLGVEALKVWLAHLNPWRLMTNIESHAQTRAFYGPLLPGVLVLGAWAAAVVLAWRGRHRDLLRLHLVSALALGLGLVSIGNVYDAVWSYLVLWGWGTTAVVLLATVWTFTVVAGERGLAPEWHRRGVLALAGVGVVVVAAFTYGSAHADGRDSSIADPRELDLVLPGTVRALRSGDLPGTGEGARYLLRWDDSSVGAGAFGIEMLLQLEHEGFDVGAGAFYRVEVGRRRVRSLGEATATIDYVVGPEAIGAWRATPGAVEVAYADPRRGRDQDRFERLRDQVVADLEAAGLDDLVVVLDRNLLAVAWDSRVPVETREQVGDMIDIGQPEAVFVSPAGTVAPSPSP